MLRFTVEEHKDGSYQLKDSAGFVTIADSLTKEAATLLAQAPAMLEAIKGLVALCLTADVYWDALLDAGEILDTLGVPRNFHHKEARA